MVLRKCTLDLLSSSGHSQLVTATQRAPSQHSARRTGGASAALALWVPAVTCARRTTSTTAPLLAVSSVPTAMAWLGIRYRNYVSLA